MYTEMTINHQWSLMRYCCHLSLLPNRYYDWIWIYIYIRKYVWNINFMYAFIILLISSNIIKIATVELWLCVIRIHTQFCDCCIFFIFYTYVFYILHIHFHNYFHLCHINIIRLICASLFEFASWYFVICGSVQQCRYSNSITIGIFASIESIVWEMMIISREIQDYMTRHCSPRPTTFKTYSMIMFLGYSARPFSSFTIDILSGLFNAENIPQGEGKRRKRRKRKIVSCIFANWNKSIAAINFPIETNDYAIDCGIKC